jgi:hypothetical protein
MARAITSPLLMPVDLAEDLKFAVETCFQQGTGIWSWRQQQFRKIARMVATADDLWSKMEQTRSDSSKRASSHLDATTCDVLRYLILWPDEGLADSILQGSQVVGELDKTGVFRTSRTAPELSMEDLEKSNDEWVHNLLKSSPPPLKERLAVWEKSETELRDGIISGWYTKDQLDAIFGKGGWRPMKRFGTFQEGSMSWRTIDNAKTSGHNRATGTEERIHTTSHETGYAIYRYFASLMGDNTKDVSFRVSTRDKKGAYRQLAPTDSQLHLSIVMCWNVVAN